MSRPSPAILQSDRAFSATDRRDWEGLHGCMAWLLHTVVARQVYNMYIHDMGPLSHYGVNEMSVPDACLCCCMTNHIPHMPLSRAVSTDGHQCGTMLTPFVSCYYCLVQ